MATVSAKCNGTYGSHYTLYLEYQINSQNIQNNTSNITVSMYAQSDSSSYKAYNLNAVNPVTITVDGVVRVSRNQAMDFRNRKIVDMGSWTGNITHNSDGLKTINISGSFSISGTSSLSGGSVSKSNWELTKIPRASTVTCADGNIGSSTTININRAVSSFTHTITYNFNGVTGTIATKTSETSLGWTIPTSFYTTIPNSQSGQGTIYCETFDGNKSLGTNSTTFNAFVINSNPILSATVVDVNSATIALTSDENKIVKYFSTAQVVISATAQNSATIVERKVICGGKTGTQATNTLTNVESNVFDVSCVDSRGFSTTTKITKTLVDYIKLAIKDLTLERPTTTSNTININLSGNYFNNSFGNSNNSLQLKFRYRTTGGSWSSYSILTPTINNNKFSLNNSLGNNYNFLNEYEFEIVATDALMTATQNVIVSRGIPIIDIGKEDIQINVDAEFTGKINGITDNHNTLNTTSDKVPVYNGNSLEYRTIPAGALQTAPTSVYENASGTSGTITMSASANNYKNMRVSYFFNGNEYCSNTFSGISNMNGYFWLSSGIEGSDANYSYLQSCLLEVSGTTITLYRNRQTGFSKNDNEIYTPSGDVELYITKVEMWN